MCTPDNWIGLLCFQNSSSKDNINLEDFPLLAAAQFMLSD